MLVYIEKLIDQNFRLNSITIFQIQPDIKKIFNIENKLILGFVFKLYILKKN